MERDHQVQQNQIDQEHGEQFQKKLFQLEERKRFWEFEYVHSGDQISESEEVSVQAVTGEIQETDGQLQVEAPDQDWKCGRGLLQAAFVEGVPITGVFAEGAGGRRWEGGEQAKFQEKDYFQYSGKAISLDIVTMN